MQHEQDWIALKDMTPAQAHAEALRRIEAALEGGQDWLYLGDLPITAVPSEISQLSHQIRSLSFSHPVIIKSRNELKKTANTTVVSEFFNFENFFHAAIDTFPSYCESICKFTSLDPISDLKNLRDLDLSGHNKIKSIRSLEKNHSLESINLSFCSEIKSIEPVKYLKKIRHLCLDFCENLEKIWPVEHLESLSSLSAARCVSVSDFEFLGSIKKLELLNISAYYKNAPHKHIKNLSKLRFLNSSLCKGVENLDDFPESANLISLNLSLCIDMLDVKNIEAYKKLKLLKIRGCGKISSLDPIKNLGNLLLLRLDGLQCAENITPQDLLDFWPNLRIFSTYLLKSTPNEILSHRKFLSDENCLPKIREWWQDLQLGEAESHELKLFILGNGRVGKSELFGRLRGENFHGELPSTHGIQLGRFELCRHHDGRPIFLNAWDFGGQDIYLGTHALFLKSRAIFLLAWHPDMETEAPYTEAISGLEMRHRPLQYWLDYIHSLAGDDARVIVVQTRCARENDEATPPLRDTTRLAWYRQTISCAEPEDGIDSLRDLLKRAARHRLESPAPPRMPASWLAVRDRLAVLRKTDKAIARERFDAICADTHQGASSDALLHYLHQAGDVFHQTGVFGDAIVLDQQWALDGIYTLFDRGRVLPLLRGSGGVFAPDMLDALAWNGCYNKEERALLLSMMENCDLVFPAHQWCETHYYAMIDALPDAAASANRIAMAWPADAQAVEAVAEYAFLHEGVLRALLARIGRLAGRDAVYWRHGVCLYDARTASRARIDTEQHADGSGRVRMRATGPEAETLCARLVELVKDIRIGEPPQITGDGASEHPTLPRSTSEGVRDVLQPAPIPLLPGQKPVVYFSYAWGGSDRKDLKDFAVRLHRALEEEFDVRRDEEATRLGDRISEFMREIGRGARVLVLLSDPYLRSPNCMRELLHLYHRHLENSNDLQKHVLPLILDADLTSTAKQRLGYVKFWKQRLIELKEETTGLDPVECLPTHHEMAMIEEFRLKTEDMLIFLDDILMPRGMPYLSENDFSAVKAALGRLSDIG